MSYHICQIVLYSISFSLKYFPSVESKNFDEKFNNGNRTMSISIHDFLDFLKLTCHVHESINRRDTDENIESIDYNALAKNELVNSLISSKSGQSPKSDANDENSNDKNGKKSIE